MFILHKNLNKTSFFNDSFDKKRPFILLKNDPLIIYCFTSRLRIFQLYGDITIAGKGLQN
jgi:hypothetical protein